MFLVGLTVRSRMQSGLGSPRPLHNVSAAFDPRKGKRGEPHALGSTFAGIGNRFLGRKEPGTGQFLLSAQTVVTAV